MGKGNFTEDFKRDAVARISERGYTMVPHLFLAQQAELGLTSPQAMVLLHLLDHWWYGSLGLPWPSKKTVASRMGVSERQVQRILTDLEGEGLIARQTRYYSGGGQKSNAYDLNGLIKRLKRLEPAFRAKSEGKKQRRAAAERPVRRRRVGATTPSKYPCYTRDSPTANH